ncbi:probable serine/threonine-protein kinase PBL1 [Nymphaea colorata]|nr:probable serine/threonine-protein kinase PBL1 [Nymphaea colorata]
MGCFTVLKNRRKKSDRPIDAKPREDIENPIPRSSERSLQSAPPSFRNRTKFEVIGHTHSERMRVLSAPSSLIVYEQEEGKLQKRAVGEKRAKPHPLPLPSPQGSSGLKHMSSFNSNCSSDPVSVSGPLPLPPLGGLRFFSFDEIVAACNNFSPDRCVADGLSTTTYRASFGDESCGSKALEATVVCLHLFKQGYKEFMSEINKIASLQHPQLCRLIGFHAREGSDQWMLVFERLFHGSLDRLLYGRPDGPPIDWSTRVKVALCAAQGLAFLHEEGPFQAMFNDFRSTNVQIDKDYSAKLSGFGASISDAEADFSSSTASANISPETLERGLVTPKSNVWSFGILLLELLTGWQNMDTHYPKAERDLAKWAKAYLSDECRLSLIIDPKLKGRYPVKAAKILADTARKCLERDPSDRPTMRAVVESLMFVQDIKYTSRFPLQEPISSSQPLGVPTALGYRQANLMTRSPSLNGIPLPPVGSRSSPSPPCRVKPLVSPPRPISLPPRSCASTVSVEEISIHEARKSISPARRSAGVAGF